MLVAVTRIDLSFRLIAALQQFFHLILLRKISMNIFSEYTRHVAERNADGLPPLPLNVDQTTAVCKSLSEGRDVVKGHDSQNLNLLDLLTHRVSPGVTDEAGVKADFLAEVAKGEHAVPNLSPVQAIGLLGTMLGGYNVSNMVVLLSDPKIVGSEIEALVEALSQSYNIDEATFAEIDKLRLGGNQAAGDVITKWADSTWFTSRPEIPGSIEVEVFKVDGESNTDDLSPASDADNRSDIPLHAKTMLKAKAPEALGQILDLVSKGVKLALCGDVLWTGSSRKSAWNSQSYIMGEAIPYVPNKGHKSIVIAGKLAPIGKDTIRDGGGLAIVCSLDRIEHGQKVIVQPLNGRIMNSAGTEQLATFDFPVNWADEYRAGGRLKLVSGKKLTKMARDVLELGPSTVFAVPAAPVSNGGGFTLAQKTIGKACGVEGVRPGEYCEPQIATVFSQDTTGMMTADEAEEQACLSFASDLVVQSFCHTAAVDTPKALIAQQRLPPFFSQRGGVVLRKGDGVIHTIGNRFVLPDQVGTGGDSHTRFPMGVSFPGGSGLVAFAAANGLMPLDMPESVLVRFEGELQPGITVRDLVNALPYVAIQQGLLTLEKSSKKNVYANRIIEIDLRNVKIGGRGLTIEQSFELADASAERSSSACCMINDPDEVVRYVKSNRAYLQNLLDKGYDDAATIKRRMKSMDEWLANPVLLEPDANCEYADTITIDISQIKEPLIAVPNDPDDVKKLSEIAGIEIDEVFTGSCMTNIGNLRKTCQVIESAGESNVVLWMAPPSSEDEAQLDQEGSLDGMRSVNANLEVPGCSLCMGNQKQVAPGAHVMSTSTRNFPNRMGKGAFMYLGSSEVAGVTAVLGRIPTVEEYMDHMEAIDHSPVHVPHQFDETGVPALSA